MPINFWCRLIRNRTKAKPIRIIRIVYSGIITIYPPLPVFSRVLVMPPTVLRKKCKRYNGAWAWSTYIMTAFPLRAGYHHESENKGNRKYFTVGAGFRMSVFSLDAGYVFSTAQSNPLDQTMRFTLGFDLDGMKDLFGRRR